MVGHGGQGAANKHVVGKPPRLINCSRTAADAYKKKNRKRRKKGRKKRRRKRRRGPEVMA